MTRSCKLLWRSIRPLLLFLGISVIVVMLLPADGLPAAARHLFQSPTAPPGDSPLPTPTPPPPTATMVPPTPITEPPTPTLEPPTATAVPPIATLEPSPTLPPMEPDTPTPEPLPTEPPAADTVVPTVSPVAEATPTEETIHLPAVEGGAQESPLPSPGPVSEAPVAEAEPVQASDAESADVSPEEDERAELALLIDSLAVLASYVWLGCGVLLLLLVPIGIVLLNRWGQRRRQA